MVQSYEHLFRNRLRMWMKSEADIMPMMLPVSSSHNGALATPCAI